jgi:hypothetical protein
LPHWKNTQIEKETQHEEKKKVRKKERQTPRIPERLQNEMMLCRVSGVSSLWSVRNTVMATIWKIHTTELIVANITDSFVARKELAPRRKREDGVQITYRNIVCVRWKPNSRPPG